MFICPKSNLAYIFEHNLACTFEQNCACTFEHNIASTFEQNLACTLNIILHAHWNIILQAHSNKILHAHSNIILHAHSNKNFELFFPPLEREKNCFFAPTDSSPFSSRPVQLSNLRYYKTVSGKQCFQEQSLK
jgi:hypothetical protein